MHVCLSILLQEPRKCEEHICRALVQFKAQPVYQICFLPITLMRVKTFPQISVKFQTWEYQQDVETELPRAVCVSPPTAWKWHVSLSTLSTFCLVNISFCQVPGGGNESSCLCLLRHHLSTETKSPGHCPSGIPKSLFPLLVASGREVSEPPCIPP